MKSFVCVCLFAAASAAPAADADADPALFYSAHPFTYNYGYHGLPAVHHSSVVKSVVSTPAKVEVKSVATPVATLNPVVYSAPTVHHPVVYNTAPLVHTPVVAKAASYYANSGGAVHVVKRDADAEPAADADADAYYAPYFGYAPYRSTYVYGAYRPYAHYW